MDMYNSSPIMDILVVSAIFIATWVVALKLRIYFSHVSTLSSTPIPLKSALLWGGVLAIICLGVLVFDLLYSRSGNDVLKNAVYFILVPAAVVMGAIYGLIFEWRSREKNFAAGTINRGLVGLALGFVAGITFSLVSAFSFDISYKIDPGYGAIVELGYLYLFPIAIVIFTIVFGLLTPRNVLLKQS